MDLILVALWSIFLLGGVVLMIVGARLRRTDHVRTGVPGNVLVLLGSFVVVGGGAGLRQELAA